jgi:hypothetical protein
MSTHEFVYQTFIIYIFIKSLIFAPLIWMGCVLWWGERRSKALENGADNSASFSEVTISRTYSPNL